MRKTRYVTWVFLVLSLAFFTIRDFRFALEAPLASLWAERTIGSSSWPLRYSPWLARLYTLDRYVSHAKLVALADEAARRGDSEFVALAALNLGPTKDALRLADRAVAANPDLAWIYFSVVLTAMTPSEWQGPSEITREELARRIERLETFDPDNATPHFLSARLIQKDRGTEWPGGMGFEPIYLDALARETAWCQEMDKAFRSRRYDSYQIRNFTLIRRVLRARGWDHPVVMATIEAFSPLQPNLMTIRNYTNLLVLKYGADAEAAGKLNEALDNYFRAAEFGNRLRLQGNSLIEQLIGIMVQRITYPKLAGALRKAGRDEEARLAEDSDRQAFRDVRETKNPLRATSYQPWLVLLVNFAAGLVAVFFLASVISVGYVNAKLWMRREKKGRLYQTLTVAENYAPLLLFLSCLALYLSDVPFGRNFEHYMTVEENLSTAEVTEGGIYPAWGLSELNPLEVPNAFQGYVPVAFAGVVLLTGALAFARWRESRREALPEPAAFERKLQTQNYALLLLVALASGALVALEPPWELFLTAGIVVALLSGAALWTSASFARRAKKNEKGTWAAKASEAGAYLLLIVLAGISGLGLGDPSREWMFLAFGLILSVAGAISASRLRFRRATPAVFGLLVVSIVGLFVIPEGIYKSGSRKQRVSARTSAPTRPSPNVPPPLTEYEVLVPVAEGKPVEALSRAATVRGVGFHEGVFGLWVLREAGADDKLIKSLRDAKWAEHLSLKKGDPHLGEAEQALRAGIKQNPRNPVLHFALALILDWRGRDSNAAIEEYRAALRLKPDFAGARRALGTALMVKKQRGAGIAELRQAVRLDPNDALAHHELAFALEDIRDQDGAIRECKAAVFLEPDDNYARLEFGKLLKEKGEFREAIQEFRELLSKPVTRDLSALTRLNLAEALSKYDFVDQSIEEYRQLLTLYPGYGEAHDGLGEVLAERGELTAAIAQFREAIRLDPESSSPRNNLGLALQRTGDLNGAIAEFQQATHLDANYADAHANLARALEKKGDLKGAFEQDRIARRLKPKGMQTQRKYKRL